MSLITTELMPKVVKLEPKKSANGGTLARKPGYHNSRNHLIKTLKRPWDYSIRWPLDQKGSGDEEAAFDWTFWDAQQGNYETIAKYSKRLLNAGHTKDPRATRYLREFYGNTDSDKVVEGWDFVRHAAASSDKSHLWHIHVSVRRKYVNDPKAMDAIYSLLSGETLADWVKRYPKDELYKKFFPPKVPNVPAQGGYVSSWPKSLKNGAYFAVYTNAPVYKTVGLWQAQMKKRGWDIPTDGRLNTEAERSVIKQFQEEKNLPVTGRLDKATFDKAWTAPVTK